MSCEVSLSSGLLSIVLNYRLQNWYMKKEEEEEEKAKKNCKTLCENNACACCGQITGGNRE